ncbi:thioredoxin family protein [Xanthobacteraceae bacterium Astr-EGSB]|uniref:thioredoxin family protein n=1 Tax=Astrobacterium formosum TaxID=3069710 RepID=UPI0027B6B478|nr:thioredoxin family protein [Xanthobacteraceae bacterium Astr-EGSB]
MHRRHVLSLFAAAVVIATMATAAVAAEFSAYSPASFDAAVKSGAPVIVHVHADWCPTCRAQAPTLQAMAGESAYAKARFIRVNFDKDKDFLTGHKISQQSTVLVFKGGKEAARFTGITDAGQLRGRVQAAL